jgi:hypothetical protein
MIRKYGHAASRSQSIDDNTGHRLHQGEGPHVERGDEPQLRNVDSKRIAEVGECDRWGEAHEECQKDAHKEHAEADPSIGQGLPGQAHRVRKRSDRVCRVIHHLEQRTKMRCPEARATRFLRRPMAYAVFWAPNMSDKYLVVGYLAAPQIEA